MNKQPVPDTLGALQNALEARKVAIFGASSTPGKMGHEMVRQLLNGGFVGELAVINKRGGSICGREASTDPSAALGADVAVLALPPQESIALVRRFRELRIPLAVLCAGGFGESGNWDMQAQLGDAARESGVAILGPNCIGFYSATRKLNLTTLPAMPSGSVSCVLQSGGVSFHVTQCLSRLHCGFDALVNLGNKSGLDFTSTLQAIVERPNTSSVLLYMEQFNEGERFLRALDEASRTVPVIILVGGTSAAGSLSAHSHTGAVLTQWDRVIGALRGHGAFVASTLDEAISAAAGGRRIAGSPTRKSVARVFVLSDGGGLATINCDALSRYEFTLPQPSTVLTARLASLSNSKRLRPANPLDFDGLADNDALLISGAFEHVQRSGEFDAVLIAGALGSYRPLYGDVAGKVEDAAASRLGSLARDGGLPVVAQLADANLNPAPIAAIRAAGISCFESPDASAAALAIRFGASVGIPTFARSTAESRSAQGGWRRDLAEATDRLARLFDAQSIPHALGTVVSRRELESAPPGRYVLRADGFAHKVRVGAIRIGVDSTNLGQAYDELAEVAKGAGGMAIIRAARYVEHDEELLLTFWRSQSQGIGCIMGTGGSMVEAAADIHGWKFPDGADDVHRLLHRSRLGRRLLSGNDRRVEALVSVVLAIARAFDGPLRELAELEINPIALTNDGAIVLDALPSE